SVEIDEYTLQGRPVCRHADRIRVRRGKVAPSGAGPSLTMRRMQRGSPLSTPPANEQRRCAEKTSRIFRRKSAFTMRRLHRGSLVHHAEDAKGISPFNPARKRATEGRREYQPLTQADVRLPSA